MNKWLAGVAATVIAGVLGGLITDWYGIGGTPNRAVARVVAFTQYGNTSNTAPSASITVENEGKKTAEDCVVHWAPGMNSTFGPVDIATNSFALDGAASQQINLRSSTTYGRTGTYSGSARIVCSNTESPSKVATVFVLY